MVELFGMIGKAGLADKLKVLGVGPNNNDFEVKLFRDKYKIPFPLIPDPDMHSIETLGNTPTPTYLILKLNGPGKEPTLLDKEIGRFTSAQDFFTLLRTATGL
jgi:peroxiredoxin